MGMMDKFLGAMRLNVPYDEELEDEEDIVEGEADEETEDEPRRHSLFSKKPAFEEEEGEEEWQPKEKPVRKAFRSSRGSSMAEQSSRNRYEVCMIVSRSAEDMESIADMLISGKAVVLNLEGVNTSEAQRIIDFTGGACYTMGGRLHRISNKIFLATPNNVEISGDFIDMINDSVDMNSLNLNLNL